MNESATYSKEKAIELVALPARNMYDQCLRFANYYVSVTSKKFTSEDLIYLHHVTHLAEPVEKRVWGAVINQLKKDGKIIHAGYGIYKNPKGHGKPVNMWISTTL